MMHNTQAMAHQRRLNSTSVANDPDGSSSSTNAVSDRFISAAISCRCESLSGRCSGLSKHVAAELPRKALVVKASTYNVSQVERVGTFLSTCSLWGGSYAYN